MTNKIEIIFNLENESRERIVSVDGIEKFHDKKAIEITINEDDPIRQLELFLLGEEIQGCCNRCCNSCDILNSRRKSRINIFSKLRQFIIKLFKISS